MIKIDRFWDIETHKWDRYVLGGVIDAGSREFKAFRDPEELFWELVNQGGDAWSWNGGLYDHIWFCDMARKLGVTCNIGAAGSKIISVRCEGLQLRDAMAIYPVGLQKASGMTGPEMSKETGLPCICKEKGCRGYCSIAPDMPAHLFEDLERYLHADCERGLDIVEKLIQEAEDSDYHLTGTVGGSSYKSAQKMLDLAPAEWKQSQYNFARSGYYGGRTEVFQPIAHRGFSYDINSAYPAALVSTPLPTGSILECETDKARRAFRRGKEGIYLARVSVPEDMYIPPLPVRVGDRICFPVGEISGVWTALELREAAELGCDVQINGGIVWSDSEKVLAPFMKHVWTRRDIYRSGPHKNKALAGWHKFVGNSVTGKLAEHPEKERVMLHPDQSQLRLCPGKRCSPKCGDKVTAACPAKGCCDRKCRGACGRWDCIDDGASIYTAPFHKISECGHVHWAAYLTSKARIQLARQLRADGTGGRSSIYCDTDSVYATKERTQDIGEALGQWGSDGPVADWFALAPKLYRYSGVKDGKPYEVIKAKGLSGINRADFDRFCAGQKVVRDRGVKTFKEAARGASLDSSIFVRKYLARSSHADGLNYGSRRLADDGKTYPQTIQQIIDNETGRKR